MWRGVVGLLPVAILLASAEAVSAQRPQLDSLRDRAMQSIAAVEPARAAERAAKARIRPSPMDTVFANPLVVAMVPELRTAGEPGSRLAAEQLRNLLGDSSSLLSGSVIGIGTGRNTVASGGYAVTINAYRDASAAEISRSILGWVGQFLSRQGSLSLYSWATLPIGADSAGLFRQAHLELATAAPGAATRCASGVVADCVPALGLIVPDDAVTVYWDSVGRYEAVRRSATASRRGVAGRIAHSCIADHSDDACSEFLRRAIARAPARRASDLAPLGTVPRQALLLTAIRMGGAGAVERLLADTSDSAVEAIERAAGQPLTNVIAEWSAGVSAARTVEHSRSRGRSSTLLWSLAFAGMALGGTRWRAR
jgi:hypothetical protein